MPREGGTIKFKEGRKILWTHKTSDPFRDPNIPLIEFVLKSGNNYRLFYDDRLESSFSPTEDGIHLAIYPHYVSYYRILKKEE